MTAETEKHDGREKKHCSRDNSLMAKQSWGRQRQKNKMAETEKHMAETKKHIRTSA